MNKPTIYIESSVISYLTARPSRDFLQLAKQRYTSLFWETLEDYAPYISKVVLEEIERGNEEAARQRIQAVVGVSVLPRTPEVENLALCLLDNNAVPKNSWADAVHIAIAGVHQMIYLLTWNMSHIANPQKRLLIADIIRQQYEISPIILTPQDMLESNDDFI